MARPPAAAGFTPAVSPSDGVNKPKERKAHDYLGHGWGFAWPADRRIIYNRASAAPDGTPWSEDKKLVWWDAAAETLDGRRRARFPERQRPGLQTGGAPKGLDAQPGDAPFILHEDGLGWLYVPKGLQDGPMPNHFEPLESPVSNALYPRDTNPPINWFTRDGKQIRAAGRPEISFRPHHLSPDRASHRRRDEPFPAASRGIAAGNVRRDCHPSSRLNSGSKTRDHVSLVTMRGAVAARALVSRRMRPLHLNGKTVHQVAIPFHWGASGPVRGDVANDLMAISGEPNVTIMETKALTCNVVPGQLPTGRLISISCGTTRRRVTSLTCIPNNRRRARPKADASHPVTDSTAPKDPAHDRRRRSEQ